MPPAGAAPRPLRALVRPPSAAFAGALTGSPGAILPDPELAAVQHARYRAALAAVGLEVVGIPAEPELPDACFVDDCAVVVGHAALVTRLGAPSRRDETAGVEAVLATLVERIERMAGPATLDGGDVLRLGGTLVVGRSRRTNDAGIERLARFAAGCGLAVRTAEVPDGTLHLQTAVTAVDDRTVVGSPELLGQPAFAGVDRRIVVPAAEAAARNVVSVGTAVVMAAGCPATASRLRALGLDVHEVELSEFGRADGGPTCLSLLV